MATTHRSTISERSHHTAASRQRGVQRSTPKSLKSRTASTAVALLALLLVVRFLPPGARSAHANTQPPYVAAVAGDLKISDLQFGSAADGGTLYLDGLVSNSGKGTVTGAMAEVEFYDASGKLLASVQQPMVGMARGGVDLVRNEFVRNPVTPGEIRFFRVAVEHVPADWNHEVPELKIVAVTPR